MMTPIESELFGLIKMIRAWIMQGLKTEEIQARLANPTGVAADLLRRAAKRRADGKAFLGRDPQTSVMAEVEPFEPPPPLRTMGSVNVNLEDLEDE